MDLFVLICRYGEKVDVVEGCGAGSHIFTVLDEFYNLDSLKCDGDIFK